VVAALVLSPPYPKLTLAGLVAVPIWDTCSTSATSASLPVDEDTVATVRRTIMELDVKQASRRIVSKPHPDRQAQSATR
jgi:hypothetical protein